MRSFLFWDFQIVFFFFFFFFLRSFSPQSEFFGVQAGTALYRSTRYIEASTNEVGVYFKIAIYLVNLRVVNQFTV